MARPNSIFQKIKQGLFTFTPAHFEPRAPGLGPVFGPGRIAVLRRKLWLEGIDPATVGLPSAAESEPTRILKKPGPNRMTIAKWDYVKEQMASMPTLREEARERRRQVKLEKSKKLPF